MGPKGKNPKDTTREIRDVTSNIQVNSDVTNTEHDVTDTTKLHEMNNINEPTSKISMSDTIDDSIKEQAKKAAQDIAYCSDDTVDSYLPLKNFKMYMNENPGIPGIGLSCSYLANNLDILTVQRFANGKYIFYLTVLLCGNFFF